MNPNLPADNSGNYLSQNFLLNLINNLSDPIFVKNRQHKWIFVNNAFCKLAGYELEELIVKSDYDFFDREETDIREKDELIFTSGISSDSEGYFTDGEGKVYIVSIKKTLFNDESGNQFIIGTITQIKASENKQAEENLLQKEEFIRTIYDEIELEIIVYEVTEDNTFHYLAINKATEYYRAISVL